MNVPISHRLLQRSHHNFTGIQWLNASDRLIQSFALPLTDEYLATLHEEH